MCGSPAPTSTRRLPPLLPSSTHDRRVTGTPATSFVPSARTTYDLPVSVSYEADVWGSVRREFRAIAEAAQISDAQLENARLLYQAELAQDYFELRGTDGEKTVARS